MALHLGVDPSWVAKVETETLKPSRTLANRMHALLGIPTTTWDDPADLIAQDGSADAAA